MGNKDLEIMADARLQAEVTALRLQRDRLLATLRRIAAWEFDLNGDCVSEATALARAAIVSVGETVP